MISPQNEVHWCKNDYLKIEPHVSYTGLDAFCDENGVNNLEMPRIEWTNTFSEENGITLVSIAAKYNTLADLEKVIEMGFKEGFTMGLNQLETLLSTLK